MEGKILSGLTVTRVISANTIYRPLHSRSRMVDRKCWGISLKYEGASRFTCGGRSYLSNSNSLMLLPRGSTYEWCCTDPGHCINLQFEAEGSIDGIFSVAISDCEKPLALMRRIELLRAAQSPERDLESMGCIYALLLFLLRETPQYLPSGKAARLQPALEHIAAHYAEPLRNDVLAAQCGISTVYFRKLFREVAGTSPVEYVHRLRIQKAQELLRGDHGSISDVAASVGYGDTCHFCRIFKRRTGMTTSQFLAREA